MKKFFSLIILVFMSFFFLYGCNNNTNTTSSFSVAPSLKDKDVKVGNIYPEFPLSTADPSLLVLVSRYGSSDYSNVYMWKKYEEMTGVNIDWIYTSRNDRAKDVLEVLSSGRQLDLIMRCKLSANRLTQYGNLGYILDLNKNDMLKTYAPNCWNYLQNHPTALASITNPDGTIYSIPQVNSGAELRVARKIFINKNWLKNVNMELPKTTSEFYSLLKAFKEKDANGNGNINDEIPLCSADWASIQESFYGAFGLGNRGFDNLTVDCDLITGKARYIPTSNEYKEFLEYFHLLYSEGLLDNNIFKMSDAEWYSNIQNNIVGVFASTNLASLPSDKIDDWVAITEAIEGPDGNKLWAPIRADFHSTGAAVIPTTCKNPELVLRWLDYFWTDEGTLFYHMGVENDTFIEKEDGTYDYVSSIYDQMTSEYSFDDVISQYSPYPGGSNPTVEIAPYFMGGEMAPIPAQAAISLFNYATDVFWPNFTFSAEESSQLSNINRDIDTYRQATAISLITGSLIMNNDNWNQYINQLNAFNLNRLIEIYQTAIDRYDNLN